MSGTDSQKEIIECFVCSVLDREKTDNSINYLINALNGDKISRSDARRDSIICIDSNVLLSVASNSDYEFILDYFNSIHEGPIVVSGQSIQEFWNNHKNTMVSKNVDRIKNHIVALKKDIERISIIYSSDETLTSIENLIEDFQQSKGYIYDSNIRQKSIDFIETLKDKLYVRSVNRSKFYKIYTERKSSKTPPGFKDNGSGDFFVWCDFLFSVKEIKNSGYSFSNVIIITDDVKVDWSVNGVLHPILSNEMNIVSESKVFTVTSEKFKSMFSL